VPYWTNLATAHQQVGDFRSELRVSNHADSLYPGKLNFQRVRAQAAIGDVDGVRQLIDSVETHSADTPTAAADLMYTAGVELRAHARSNDADAMFARARTALAALTTEQAARRNSRMSTANVLFAMGRFDSAYTRYVELVRDTTDIVARGRAGVSAAALRDTATARRIADELANAHPRFDKGGPTYWRAAIAAQLGDKQQAVRLLNQAITEGVAIGATMHRNPELQSLHDYGPFKEILRPKG
jgi:hypothetical protein